MEIVHIRTGAPGRVATGLEAGRHVGCRHEWEAAVACCREIITADPYREDAIRQLLRCLAETGRLAEVERTYRLCRERIWRDLQVEPAPETRHLYRQLTGASLRRSALTGS